MIKKTCKIFFLNNYFYIEFSEININEINNFRIKNFLLSKDKFENQLDNNKLKFNNFNKTTLMQTIKFMEELNYHIFWDEKVESIKKINLIELKDKGLQIKEEKESHSYLDFINVIKKEISRTLTKHQLKNSYFHYKMKSSANFSLPGSGKTSTIYSTYSYLKYINEVNKILIVGPKNSYHAWKNEYKCCFNNKPYIFTIEDLNGKTFKDFLKNKEKLKNWLQNYDIFFFGYESLLNKDNLNNLFEILDEKTYLVIDESHKIKNSNSQRFKSCFELSKNIKYKTLMSGTPIPNGLKDIWTTLNIMHSFWYDEFWKLSERDLNSLVPYEKEKFKIDLSGFYVRTTKDELNIPKANEDIILNYSLTKDEEDLYDRIMVSCKSHFELYIRLIQMLIDPTMLRKKITDEIDFQKNNDESDDYILDEDEEIIKDKSLNNETTIINEEVLKKFDEKISSKMSKIIKLIKELNQQNKNVLVWSTFISPMEKLKNKLEIEGIKCFIINGSVDIKKRDEILNEFKSGTNSVLITNPQTMAESISLHKECHDAIYLDYSYNLVHMLQSRDRIHRLGITEQERPNYYYFVLEDSYYNIEYIIYKKLKEKEQLMLSIIESKTLNNFKENFSSIKFIESIILQELKKRNQKEKNENNGHTNV